MYKRRVIIPSNARVRLQTISNHTALARDFCSIAADNNEGSE